MPHLWDRAFSSGRPSASKLGGSLPVIRSIADLVEGLFNRLLVLPLHLVQNVPSLVSPTALVGDLGIDDL